LPRDFEAVQYLVEAGAGLWRSARGTWWGSPTLKLGRGSSGAMEFARADLAGGAIHHSPDQGDGQRLPLSRIVQPLTRASTGWRSRSWRLSPVRRSARGGARGAGTGRKPRACCLKFDAELATGENRSSERRRSRVVPLNLCGCKCPACRSESPLKARKALCGRRPVA